jgi:GLPGLI family protein
MVKRYFILWFWVAFWVNAYAQNKLTQGKVTYEITYRNLPAAMADKQQYLPRVANMYFNDSMLRTEMGIGMQNGENVTIHNTKSGQITVLLTMYNQHFALIKHDSDLIALRKEMGMDKLDKNIKITVYDSITKNIAGYSCYKAVIESLVDGKSVKTDCWFTKSLPPVNTISAPEFKQINGFLMQYSSNLGGVTTSFKAKMVTAMPVNPELFEIPPNYLVVTENELVRLLNFYKNKLEQENRY